MTRRLRAAAALLLAAPAAVATEVSLLEPPAWEAVFGEVEIRAEVRSSQPVRRVDFYLDGSLVGRRESPPWEVRVDVGQANVEHHFRVVAVDLFGATAEAETTTRRIAVDDDMEVELQQLFVSVARRDGSRQLGLPESSFRILDAQGRREQITTFFGGGDLPISSVLLVDASASMEGPRLEAALRGVRAYAELVGAEDETMVALFSDRLLGITPFSDDSAALLANLREVTAAGGTAVNDHLYFALNRLEPRLGRRVVVLLSDGADVSSFLDMEEVLWRARRSQAMLFWIRMEDGQDQGAYQSAWRDAPSNQRQQELLRQAIVESGGRILAIRRLEELEVAFRSVVEELRQQYVLGFHPAVRHHDGSWRPIRVEVGGAYEVRARAGFVDD